VGGLHPPLIFSCPFFHCELKGGSMTHPTHHLTHLSFP
jgi:hypothetical protein